MFLCTKQRNYCVSLLRKTKKAPNDNLNEMCVNDNKIFWKQSGPFSQTKL